MALKRLTTEEMVQISASWVAKGGPARKAIGASPELAGLLPRLDAAHQALHAAQPTVEDPRLAALGVEAAAVDLAHDTAIRGLQGLLSSLALLAGPGPRADELGKLLELLLPDGLEATQKTYRAEAGAADLLATRLAGEPAAKKLLKEIPAAPKRTAQHVVDEWLAHAKRLGALEDERARLLGAIPSGEGTKTVAARNQWIRAANALIANAALGEIDAPLDQLLFAALRLAEKAANRRGKPAPEADEAAPPPAPAPTPG